MGHHDFGDKLPNYCIHYLIRICNLSNVTKAEWYVWPSCILSPGFNAMPMVCDIYIPLPFQPSFLNFQPTEGGQTVLKWKDYNY